MSLTGMKKHIRLFEEAELVTTEKVGRVRRCMLAPYAFQGIGTWLRRLDRFAQVLERTKLTQTMRFETTEQRDTTMQYGVEEGAKSGFARIDAMLEKIAA